MTVLITRPTEDSQLLADVLKKANIDSFVEPMFHVKHLLTELDDRGFKLLDGSVFTSRHAVRPLPGLKDLPCFVVGESTALEAKKHGFNNIFVAQGNVESLLNLIQNYSSEKTSRLLYLRGAVITLDIAKILSKQNIVVEERVVYRTDEIKTLSSEFIKRIMAADIKTAVFFSLNTAKIFIKRLQEKSLLSSCHKITCFVMSKKIQDMLLNVGFCNIIVFNEDTKQLIASLGECYKSDKTK
ncbi:MAG: uroporphyrinogen-III synthase [Rickettsiales bacterium]|nr:uroporphyrinogen-III synthase [Rickettsiales bacterium]